MRLSDDVVFRDLDGEAVILDLVSGRYFGLNPVGTRIWTLLDAGHSIEAIVAALVEEYEVDADRATEDVRQLIDELTARRLVVADPSTSAEP